MAFITKHQTKTHKRKSCSLFCRQSSQKLPSTTHYNSHKHLKAQKYNVWRFMAFLQAFTPKNTSKSRQKTPKITLNFNLRVSIFNFYIFPTIFHNFPNFQCSVFTMIWRSFVHNKKSETTKLFIFVELQNFPFFFYIQKSCA